MELWETWSKEELENQMSPSRWNPTKSADEVIPQHISVSTEDTAQARQRIPHKLDIAYGSSDTQKYDLYGSDLAENAPIVFWVHGGYWQEGSKEICGGFAKTLYANGIKTIVLGYTLAPQATVFQIQEEFYKALTKAMDDHREANFVVGGHSAGGQLAASILHENCKQHEKLDVNRISGFLLFSGVFDLRPLVATYVNDALKLTRNEAELLSPLLQPIQFPTSHVPIFICVGSFDSPEFQRQSREYTEKLQKKFRNVKLWVSSGDDHFTIVEGLSSSSENSSAAHTLNFLKSISFK